MPRLIPTYRRGFTLIELLIVITIMMLLAAVAVPRVLPAFKDRKMRELSRQLNAYVAGTKARAAERGRPVGLWFQRSIGNPNECLQVYTAEPAGVYTGDSLGETATFTQTTNSSNQTITSVTFGSSQTLTAANYGLVNDTDGTNWVMARFNHQGGFYKCQKVAGQATFTFYNNIAPPIAQAYINQSNNGSTTLSVSFEVILPPRRSSVAPLDVSGGLAIDLSVSGSGAANSNFAAASTTDKTPVILMFTPGGEVSDMYVSGVNSIATGSTYFLIGENNATAISPSDWTKTNIQNPLTLWVGIGAKTGSITTAENFWNPTWSNGSYATNLKTCRKNAISNQTKGGG